MNNLKVKCPKCQHSYTISLDRDLIRTLPIITLYWGVYVKIISEHLGYYPDEMHAEFKLMFNPKDSKIRLGEKYGGTTTRMTRKEFSVYLEKIKAWAWTEHGITLPDPE